MNIKAGDKVKFLNEVGGGVVTRIDEKGIAFVRTEDDFEVPVIVSELLKNEDDVSMPVSEVVQQEPSRKPETVSIKTATTYYAREGSAVLALAPEYENAVHQSDIILYLINDCNYPLHYLVTYTENEIQVMLKQGILESDTKIKVKKFNQADISKIKLFKLQGFWYKDGILDTDIMLDQSWDISSYIFYKPNTFSENDYFEQDACIMGTEAEDEKSLLESINAEDIAASMMEKDLKKEDKTDIKVKNQDIMEVDLHIENIVDEYMHLSNGEIINIQLDRFETAINTAINSKVKRIVFIHGVGNGKLKYELRKILETKYPDVYYQDASFKEYGYGATMVKIR
jgi:hypothetical protein